MFATDKNIETLRRGVRNIFKIMGHGRMRDVSHEKT